ncbi:MAG: BatD family protein [bacterium]
MNLIYTFTKKLKLIALLCIILITQINAQQFTASTDYSKIGVNDRFQVTFALSGADNSNITNFRPPSFSGFKILSGPNQSSSVQIINGKMSASYSFSYILVPTSIGKFKIGSASISQSGKTFNSNELSIEIIQGSSTGAKNNNSGDVTSEDIRKDLFILAIPDKNTVYKGDQVTVTYKIFTRLNISSPQISKLPQFNGFWTEELDLPNNIVLSDEMYNGERFKTAVIKKAALFPSSSGQLKVTPFELKIPVVLKKKRNSRNTIDDFFDDPFFSRTETREELIRSNTITINSLPLPSSNIPISFTGVVGSYTFEAAIDKQTVTQNEPFTLKLVVTGKGNIKLADIPNIKLPGGFEKYEPKTSERINRIGSVSGQKTIEYLIVPRVTGQHKIPPVEFAFFDPNKKTYVVLKSPEFNLSVKKGNGTYDASSSGLAKEDIQLLNEDIRFIKTDLAELIYANDFSLLTKWFWFLLIAPLLFLFGAIKYIKQKEKLSGNLQLSKYKKAEKAAKLRLKTAKSFLDLNDLPGFYNSTYNAVFGYLEDKLGIQKSDFTIESVISELTKRNVSDDLIVRVKALAEKCEYVRFAPKGESQETAHSFFDLTVKLIIDLDNNIIGRKKK